MCFLLNPDAKEFIAEAGGGTSQQRALHGQPGEWRGWPQRRCGCTTTGSMGVSAVVGTAAPSQRKPRRVPGYETEPHIRRREKKTNNKRNEAGASLTSAGEKKQHVGLVRDRRRTLCQ